MFVAEDEMECLETVRHLISFLPSLVRGRLCFPHDRLRVWGGLFLEIAMIATTRDRKDWPEVKPAGRGIELTPSGPWVKPIALVRTTVKICWNEMVTIAR